MYVLISSTGNATVEGIEDLARLEVLVPADMPPAKTAEALNRAGLGALGADGFAWLQVDALQRVRPASDGAWQQGFQAMLSFARGRNWLSTDGNCVRAHVTAGDEQL